MGRQGLRLCSGSKRESKAHEGLLTRRSMKNELFLMITYSSHIFVTPPELPPIISSSLLHPQCLRSDHYSQPHSHLALSIWFLFLPFSFSICRIPPYSLTPLQSCLIKHDYFCVFPLVSWVLHTYIHRGASFDTFPVC